MSSKIRVLVGCHDPGGTIALRPVLRRLRENPAVELRILAGGFARRVLDPEKFCCDDLPTMLTAPEAAVLVDKEKPDVLLTGTSWASDAEQQLRNVAAAKDLRSVVLLDYWTNYRSRWQGAVYPIESLPDFVTVMDERCRNEMLAEGFPEEKIIVTGQPYVEELFAGAPEPQPWGTVRRVLFISLPLSNVKLKVSPQEQVVMIAKILVRLAKNQGRPHELTVKLHPKETMDGWAESVNVARREGATVRIKDGVANLDVLVAQSDLVIGFASMALLNARSVGKQVVSLEGFSIEESLRDIYGRVGIIWCKSDEISVGQALMIDDDFTTNDPPQGLFRGAALAVEKFVIDCASNSLLFSGEKVEP